MSIPAITTRTKTGRRGSCVRYRLAVTLLASSLAAATFAASDAPRLPDVFPTCPAPQPIAPIQQAPAASWARFAVAWNGKEFGVLSLEQWGGSSAAWFQRFFADGSPVASAVGVMVGNVALYTEWPPALVWTGSGYLGAFVATNPLNSNRTAIYTVYLNSSGGVVAGPTNVSDPTNVETVGHGEVALAWSPSATKGAVVWSRFYGPSDYDVLATQIGFNGSPIGSPVTVTSVLQHQRFPAVAWSASASTFQIVWQDFRSASKYEIWGRQLKTDGTFAALENRLIPTSGAATTNATFPALVDIGPYTGMAWIEDGASAGIGFGQVWNGLAYNPIGIATGGATNYYFPRIVWTGAEFGVFWSDQRGGALAANYFQRVSDAGGAIGPNVRLGTGYDCDAAFARRGFLMTFGSQGPGTSSLYTVPIGCSADTTPPSCPGNLLVYNVTGSSATVAWSPSDDIETDLAAYVVYQNNAAVARTSNTYYAASGLSVDTTYNFLVQPVNAAQLQGTGCTSSVYLKTNASLTLMVNKSTDDARLDWTDAGMNNYNVFRGTSPQVMSLIGSTAGLTADDPNVLLDSVAYFYTVDEPGW